MRFARKLMLLAIAAVAAMAFAASPASATSAIEVVDETNGGHCSSLASPHTSGGCPVHAEGTIKLEVWIFTWVTERTCDVEFSMHVGEDGTGAVDSIRHFATEPASESNCASDPPVATCDTPWEGKGERVSSTVIHATSSVCIDPSEGDVCGATLEYDIVESAGENYAVSFVNSNIGSFCRINGNAAIENSTGNYTTIHVN